jgi:hypothetical protein
MQWLQQAERRRIAGHQFESGKGLAALTEILGQRRQRHAGEDAGRDQAEGGQG